MGLTYTKPKIEESNSKPQAIANKGFPYQSLADPRRFEELLYAVGIERIENGDWKNLFDEIRLLQGVRERGRDCIMTLKGDTVALIQCKHTAVAERVSLPTVAREIIKFVLHSMVEPKLIHNKDQFIYFFAVAYGFTENASNLISNFNDQIIKHPELETWTQKVISGNASLGQLDYEQICEDLKDTLSRIRIKPILPQDIDKLLLEEGRESIIKIFFEVRSVIDPKVSNQILDDLGQIKESVGYRLASKLPLEVILEKIAFASYQLTSYNNSFEGVENSHLDRTETSQIVRWVKEPIRDKHKPIAILSGNAGSGKTVILQDVYKKLKADGIPVIGIKADRQTAQSIKELEDKLNLEDSFEKIIRSLSEDNERVVIIIDQIDALSQSLSARRDYLDTFNLLVRRLSTIEKTRIVVSARIYDLNYDNELKFYKNQKVFNLGLLNVGQVDQILSHLKINKATLSQSLYDLLRTPHHLNVLCKVHNEGVNLSTLKS
ncbi:ATP-binding protein [Algoriphagus aestuarii]|nr:ATP-binding protein [Algoriphagus aestuarii]